MGNQTLLQHNTAIFDHVYLYIQHGHSKPNTSFPLITNKKRKEKHGGVVAGRCVVRVLVVNLFETSLSYDC